MSSNQPCLAGVLPTGGCTADAPEARLRLAAMASNPLLELLVGQA
jgi:hypothetical protein